MATLTETLAGRYATAVVDVLAGHFPDLKDRSLGRIVPEEVARQAEAPMRSFELIVTYTREWRLHPVGAGLEPWRVELACHKNRPTGEDVRFSDSVNARLRAITLED
jgi:hypothetical protein